MKKSFKRDPNHVNALTSLGILFFKIQKYTDSFNYIERAISVSEHDDWRALLAMGCILSDGKQDYVAANGYFDKCECLNRGSNLVNLNKSQNLILLGSYVEAEKLLKERILDQNRSN